MNGFSECSHDRENATTTNLVLKGKSRSAQGSRSILSSRLRGFAVMAYCLMMSILLLQYAKLHTGVHLSRKCSCRCGAYSDGDEILSSVHPHIHGYVASNMLGCLQHRVSPGDPEICVTKKSGMSREARSIRGRQVPLTVALLIWIT